MAEVKVSDPGVTVSDPSHPSHLRDELADMWRNGELLDYEIPGQYRTFRVHSIVLAAVSPIFRGILQSERGEAPKAATNIAASGGEAMKTATKIGARGSRTSTSRFSTRVMEDEGKKGAMSQEVTWTVTKIGASERGILTSRFPTRFMEDEGKKGAMLQEVNLKGEPTKKEVTLPVIRDELMQSVIEFAYTGTCTVNRENLMGLIQAGFDLQMSQLVKVCEEQVGAALRPDNCFPWYSIAKKLQLSFTMTKVIHLQWSAYKEVILMPDFKTQDVEDLKQFLYDLREYGTSCDDLLLGVICWLKEDTENRSAYLHELLVKIPVRECTPQGLQQVFGENADLLASQHSFIFSESLIKAVPQPFADGKTVLVMGGMLQPQPGTYRSDTTPTKANKTCYELRDGQVHVYANMPQELEIKPYNSICRIPQGFMMTGGGDKIENSSYGHRCKGFTNSCFKFSFQTKSWTQGPPMLTARCGHGSGYIKGKVVVAGGEPNDGRQHNMVEHLELENNVWCNGPNLPVVLKNKANSSGTSSFRSTSMVCCHGSLFILSDEEFFQLIADDKMSCVRKESFPDNVNFSTYRLVASEENIFAVGNKISYTYNNISDQWTKLTGLGRYLPEHSALVYYSHKLYLFECFSDNYQQCKPSEYNIRADKWSISKAGSNRPGKLTNFTMMLVDAVTN